MKAKERSQGADLVRGGVRYRTWAPGQEKVEVVLFDQAGQASRVFSLGQESDGYFSGIDPEGAAGDRYKYRFGGNDWPDPASRFNPDGVHGSSEVIEPRDYAWSDHGWSAPPVAELILYELHLGTFTLEGTFQAAIAKLDHLVELGVNAIELMPIADFPGARNWGYDGVLLYAPARVYGRPNDLRALIDAAHARGLAVVLDVVYNHLGPDGNYLGIYSRDYFNPEHKTPWGDAFHFELQPVREFFVGNAAYWQREFHIDGFRLDATHAILDTSETHVLAEIAASVQSLGGFVIAEDERNEIELLQPRADGGIGLDAMWADDFHHVVRVMLTGTREGYYRSYEGTVAELAATLEHGWLLEGETRSRQHLGEPAAADDCEPGQFVFCIMNHDQIGNHAFGARLNHVVSPEAFRATSALLCLAPYTPLILMGQEWAASSPFQFFTDHEPKLGQLVTEGRRNEFSGFAAFRDPAVREKIPDPQAAETFLRCKLDWKEVGQGEHAATLGFYRELLRLRREAPAFRERARADWEILEPVDGILRLLFGLRGPKACLVLADLVGGHALPNLPRTHAWEEILCTNEKRFGGNEAAPFSQPEVRVYRGVKSA